MQRRCALGVDIKRRCDTTTEEVLYPGNVPAFTIREYKRPIGHYLAGIEPIRPTRCCPHNFKTHRAP